MPKRKVARTPAQEAELADIRDGIRTGLDQARRGELIDGEEAIEDAFEQARVTAPNGFDDE